MEHKFQVIIGALLGFILTVFLFILIIAFIDTANIFSPDIKLILNNLLGPIAAGFGGALAGSRSAFHFQNQNSKKQELLEEARLIGGCLYTLGAMHQDIGNAKIDAIFPNQENPLRFLTTNSLSRYFEVRKDLNLKFLPVFVKLRALDIYNHLYKANHYYAATCRLASEFDGIRSSVFLELSKAGFIDSDILDLRDLSKSVGEQKIYDLYNMFEKFSSTADEAMDAMTILICYIQDACKPHFFGKTKIHFMKKEALSLPKITKPHFEDLNMLIAAVRKPKGYVPIACCTVRPTASWMQ